VNKGSPSATVRIMAHVVGRNADRREADDTAIWQSWQVRPNSDWGAWKTLGKPAVSVSLTQQYMVGRNQDDRQEIFATGTDGNVWQIWQTLPNKGWSNWKQLGYRRQFALISASYAKLQRGMDLAGSLITLNHAYLS
jgi:hypothetical protein